MMESGHEIHVLVSIAKVDASLNHDRSELAQIPGGLDKIDKAVAELDAARQTTVDDFESKQKERRDLEQQLQDHEAQVIKYKGQLMEVKTNKEYTAMLKEIETQETEIDKKEERLLELMDLLEGVADEHEGELEKMDGQRGELLARKQDLEKRRDELGAEIKQLEGEKPKYLNELGNELRRRYQRLSDALHGTAVTRVEGESCAGCGTRIPPQRVVEVKQCENIVTCEACGRILVYYP